MKNMLRGSHPYKDSIPVAEPFAESLVGYQSAQSELLVEQSLTGKHQLLKPVRHACRWWM